MVLLINKLRTGNKVPRIDNLQTFTNSNFAPFSYKVAKSMQENKSNASNDKHRWNPMELMKRTAVIEYNYFSEISY